MAEFKHPQQVAGQSANSVGDEATTIASVDSLASVV